MMRQGKIFIAAGLIAVALVGGCTSNKAGNTTCKEFNSQDKKTQNSEIAAMLKDEHSGKEPSNGDISLTRMSAEAFCRTKGTQDSTISDINHG